MKRWLSFVAVVVLALALVIGAACGGEGEDGEEEGVTELKMGVGLPMLGTYGAIVGMPAKYAFSMAVEDVGVFTVGGKEYRWKLYFEDNVASVAGGAASATKLIFENNVDFMHQATGSPGLAAESICREKGIILDMSGANPEHFTPDKPLFFQTAATWVVQMAPFFDWLVEERPEVQRVAFVVPDDDTGYALGDGIEACCDHYGLDVVSPEYTPVAMTEYFPVATKVMSKDPDLFLTTTGAANEAMWDMGYEGLSATWYWLPSYAEDVGWDRCQGYLIFMPIPLAGLYPEAEAKAAEFEDRYGVECTPAAFWALNVMYVLTDVLMKAGTVDDTAKIVETMETENFESLLGPIYYGGEELNGIGHMSVWPSPIYEVIGENEYRVIDVYTPEETETIVNEVFK